MKNGHQHDRRPLAGAALAAGLLVAAGIASRELTGSLADVSGSVLLPPGTLRALPLNIGSWQGTELQLDDHLVAATDTEDHLFRAYQRHQGDEVIKLFVAYGVRFRELLPHRPEVCYPGSGWSLESVREVELETGSGAQVPARVFRFARGGLTNERISVLSYYLVDGEACADESRLREVVAQRQSAGFMAQVQVTARHPLRPQLADDSTMRFAADATAAIRALLVEAVGRQRRESGR